MSIDLTILSPRRKIHALKIFGDFNVGNISLWEENSTKKEEKGFLTTVSLICSFALQINIFSLLLKLIVVFESNLYDFQSF